MGLAEKPIRDIAEADIQELVRSRRTEGPTLEYKSEIYDNGDRGGREFLQDVCMLANASGGHIVIGVVELRDPAGQPTGAPDPAGVLGVECGNPEQELLSLEARVLEAIDERLAVEQAAVPCGNGRVVIVIRVPNSLAKPHRVRYQGRTYFPSRRERQRYELNAREIKDLAMRTASRAERIEALVTAAISDPVRLEPQAPVLVVAIAPVFSESFAVNLRDPRIVEAVGHFQIGDAPAGIAPYYTVRGLTRNGPRDITITFGHNGLLKLRAPLAGRPEPGHGFIFYPTAIDILIRNVTVGAAAVFDAAGLGAPVILGVSLWTNQPYLPRYHEDDPLRQVPGENHVFPTLALTALGEAADAQVQPLCDHVHQAFGATGSPLFDAAGRWIG